MKLLQEIESIHNLQDIPIERLIKIKGIGLKKAAMIRAALELSKRVNANHINNQVMNHPQKIFECYKSIFTGKKQEYFYALYLYNSKKVVSFIREMFLEKLI